MKSKIFAAALVFLLLISGMLVAVGEETTDRGDEERIRPEDDTLDTYPFEQEYPSVTQLNDWYNDLVNENPNITEKVHLGESWEGRDMWAIKVSDHVAEEENEPSVFIDGNIHAREWSTSQVATYYLWRLVNDYGSNETITWLVNNRQIYVAPMVNPDGYIYDGNGNLSRANGWRKNRNDSTPTDYVGVDLNRNWDIDWESGDDDPSSYTYHGEAPFSEYETKNLEDFILSYGIDSYQDLHSHAGTLLIPNAHTGQPSPHDDWYRNMAGDMTSMTSFLGDENQQYSYGQPEGEIGYSAPGGAYDWAYNKTGAIGLSYELYTPGTGLAGFYPDEEYIMDINEDVYDSLVYQARIADIDLGDGSNHIHPPSPYIVYGKVTDEGGDPLVDTEVAIENVDTGEIISIKTDQNGYYELNFGNFVGEGYTDGDTFSIQAENFASEFTIGNRWGQRRDIEVVEPGSPAVTLTEPSQGGNWSVGDDLQIEWETDNGTAPLSSIDLEYTMEEKSDWSMIAEEIDDTGSYSWTVPGEIGSKVKIRVTVRDENDLEDTDISPLFNITVEDVTDVPEWDIGSNWTYDQEFRTEEKEDNWLMMNESITYTVAGIGYHEYNGSTYYSYNLSLEGDIQDGEGEFDGYPIVIEDGQIQGYMLVRVSDLGVIVDHQYREIDGYVEGEPVDTAFDAFYNLTRYYQSVVEEYDFPLWRDEIFWANTTVETFGDYKFEDESGLIQETGEFYELKEINQTNKVSPELKEIEVTAGNYTAYKVNNTMENETSQMGNMKNWYNETVGWFVKQSLIFSSGDFGGTIERRLRDSALQTLPHSQDITPNPQDIGQDITISGHMEGYADTTLSVNIPYSQGKQQWTVNTDSEGYYELTIQVPHIEDNTPTHSYYSSEGIITSVEGDRSEKIVTTLVTMMETYELEIDSTEGGEVIEPGENTFTYNHGDEVDLSAQAKSGYHFDQWTGDVEQVDELENHDTTVEMLDDCSITAEFEKEYVLTMDVEGKGSIEPSEGTHIYNESEGVMVTADPDEHWHFDGWTGDYEGPEKEVNIVMDQNKTLTAVFVKEEYTLDVDIEGGGEVELEPDRTEFEHGENVTLTARPDDNWAFEEWTGDLPEDEEGTEINITMDENKSVTVHFQEEEEEETSGFTSIFLLLAVSMAVAIYRKKKR